MPLIIKSGEFDLRGYEIIRTQFFMSAIKTSMSFSKNGIRFSSACVQKFCNVENVEVQVHPFNHTIAVLPCSEHNKNKMCWAKIYANGISIRTISAKAFLDTLYELFGWDMDKQYRLRGEIIQGSAEPMALFDARTPEVFTSHYDMTLPPTIGFGDDYYNRREAKMLVSGMPGSYSEFDDEPWLRPTAQKESDRNIKALIEKMQKEEG